MSTTHIEEFFFVEVEEEGYPADVRCLNCRCRAEIVLSEDFENKTKRWTNPNAELIASKYRDLLRWMTINPEAVKLINDSIDSLCCPKCESDELYIVTNSEYSMFKILESLECHLFD